MLQPVTALQVCHLLDLLLLKSTRWTITAARPEVWNRLRVARLWCCRLLFAAPLNKPLSTAHELSTFQSFENIFLFWLGLLLKDQVGSLSSWHAKQKVLSNSMTLCEQKHNHRFSRKMCIVPLFYRLKHPLPCRYYFACSAVWYATPFFAGFSRCNDSYPVSSDFDRV